MGADGYVLPYFDITGKPIPFYRVKLFDQKVKYLQLADSPNHIYFPPGFANALVGATYIVVTEGEKKAACAVKHGIPCVALSGVDSWRSRTLILPKDTSIAQKPTGAISARLPAGSKVQDGHDTAAEGLSALVQLVIRRKLPLIMIYDSDDSGKRLSYDVQRAAAVFGFELRHRGISHRNIRQFTLGWNKGSKVGLDDYLQEEDYGAELLKEELTFSLSKRQAFPCHPNTKEYVNKRLARTQLPRNEQASLSIAMLSDLDARGQRLRAPDEQALYYFSHEDKSLTKVQFTVKPDFAETEFGRKLYRDYNLSWTDQKVLGWLMTQFSGEEPIEEVRPEKVMTWRKDTLYYHINNGTMARVTKDRIDLLDNGEDGVVFEAGLISEIPTDEFRQAVLVQKSSQMANWWYDVLKQARVKDTDDDKQRKLLALLYYISPFFYRWHGTQLPVEITTGEPGSGKSTLFELRLSILTGYPTLRNSPSDLRDWNASLASTGGLHVTDNVQLTNNDMKQRLSDEICRLVTEPAPSIEQRKLYSDTALIKIPVKCVFGITAVKMPFQNVDIIQRAIITELDKGVSVELKYDAEWKEHQLANKGGRAHWLAHQLLFVQRMLLLTNSEWRPRYQARYRLINVEQLLMLAAKVTGWNGDWIPAHLEKSRDKRMSETDWALEGLCTFAATMESRFGAAACKMPFSPSKVSEWAEASEEFNGCNVLTQPRSLQRYMSTNKHTIATTANIVPTDDGKAYRTRSQAEQDETAEIPKLADQEIGAPDLPTEPA